MPETTRIVVQKNLYPNLDKIRISKKNTIEITNKVDQYNKKPQNFFSSGVWGGSGGGGGGGGGGWSW